jgi:alcohol dehydrogenase (cytochrome c)
LPLWAFQTGAGMNAPTTSFEHNGKQYIVGLSAGNVLVGAARGDSVWLFGLDGTLPPAAARDTEARTTAVSPSDAAPAVAAAAADAPAVDGKLVFQEACVACHGEDGRGGHGGGAPLDMVTDPELVVAMVNYGRGSMPPLTGVLTNDQIRAVAAYVTTELFQ